jgi:hypothetical protein
MSVLSGEQIGVLIYDNHKWGPGGNAAAVTDFLDTAIAVALAESGGRTDAVSATHDYGLFQINKSAHPDLFSDHQWDDPRANIDMARLVWERAGKSFNPWTTYKNGAYKSHLGYGPKVYAAIKPLVDKGDSKGLTGLITAALSPAAAVADAVGVPDLLNPGKQVAKGINAVAGGILTDIFNWLASAFLTVGAALLAGLLLILGVWFLVKDTDTGKKIGGGVKDAAVMAATKGAV